MDNLFSEKLNIERHLLNIKPVKFKQITKLPHTLNKDGQKERHSWPIHNFHTWLVNYPHFALLALPPPLQPAVLSKNFTHTLPPYQGLTVWLGQTWQPLLWNEWVYSAHIWTQKGQIYAIQLMPQVYECEGLRNNKTTSLLMIIRY